jgi:transposase
MTDQPTYRSHVWAHLGLVAGMFDALGMGEVIDQTTPHNPERRDLTVGEAVKAMGLHGLGCSKQALDLVPRCFPQKPPSRLLSPRTRPDQRHDDALGRALDTLYADGVTELYSLIAAHAAERLGLAPRVAHLDSTSVHGDGRDNSDAEPEAQVVHIPRGYSRDHRPDLHQVMGELMVEHHAGSPLLRPPLRGHSSDAQDVGEVVRRHVKQLPPTYGLTYLVADSALSTEAHLDRLAQTQLKWSTRVPAPLRDAPAALAHADAPTMASLQAGYRARDWTAAYGGVAQRGVLLCSEPRPTQAQRRVDKQLRTQSDQEVKAVRKLCNTTFACAADARQALWTFEPPVQATFRSGSTGPATPRSGKRGRPGPGAHPDPLVDQIEGSVATSMAARQARIEPRGCFILATTDRDHTHLPPHELLQGDQGQGHAERGFRFRKDPQCFASSLYLNKPERSMALLLVMTVCLRVYAALEYRIRQARKDHEATCPDHKSKPIQHPTAQGVFHDFVGIHVLLIPGPWPLVMHLPEEHQHLLRLLGKPYRGFYGVKYS